MRRSRGALLPPIAATRLRRRDVYRALRDAVLGGALAPRERLPSTRQAAADYGVSRGMLEEVYDQLAEEGFLERAIGRGTFVAAQATRLATAAQPSRAARRAPAPSRRGRFLAARAACREPDAPRPFNAGVADAREFPWKTWQRLQARAIRELGADALGFADPRGLWALRAAIARYLAQFRGLACRAEQVVIFNGAQQALHALAVLLLDPGEAAWLEDPSYPGARAAFELAGVRPVPVPVDGDGLRVDLALRCAPSARLAYVTPSHQYPTGAVLSLERRMKLLAWARRGGRWVIEDDYDGEFRYAGAPLASLATLDPEAPVLYVGTLSKAMFVALRLAYAVVPASLVEPLANLRTQLDGFTPPAAQMATSLFLDEGHFAAHLRRMRVLYGERRAALVEVLAPLAERGWWWNRHAAGLHLALRHPKGAHVRAVARASALDLAVLSAYRSARVSDDGLFLRFAGLEAACIRDGAEQLVADIRGQGRRPAGRRVSAPRPGGR